MVAESNPVLVRRFRGGQLESLHRGCWALVDTAGRVIAGQGDPDQPIFARSASKSMQAMAALRLGVLDRFGLGAEHVAVMLASHSGEARHVDVVGSLLDALGLDESALQCGSSLPWGQTEGEANRLQHNCSGKHAGFLAGALALGQDPATYLDPASPLQQQVRAELRALADVEDSSIGVAVDGCGAPTFVLPLAGLATATARIANPDALIGLAGDPQAAIFAASMVKAASAHPDLVAGREPLRFDTALIEATHGRLFAKVGADGVQVVGVCGADVALAAKIDDGNKPALFALVLEVLAHHGYIDDATLGRLAPWSDAQILNADGAVVGERIVDLQ